jgi:superfamily II DNA or RNA helicase
VILCTNSLFRSENGFRDWVRRLAPKCTFTLIADEVHNFGAVRALAALPEDVKWRIGLSATPRRQYDPEGTHRLNEYFGEEVFEFSVAEAISSGCLVPYDYFPHIVTLSPDEAVRFEELSDRIRQLGFLSDIEGDSFGDSDSHLEALLRERRAIVEQAHAKLDSLRVLLAGRGTDLQHALFYCSAKAPVIDPRRQIEKVNELLMEERILFHQVTNEETGSQLAEEILSAFSRGDLQALTAMKVLDEGVDIPQTRTAFLLASSSVQREWVQRRGRVLRQAPGKATATLHDFVVSPAGLSQSAGRSLLKSEISRVIAFGRDSRNQYSPNGSLSVVESLEDTLHGR